MKILALDTAARSLSAAVIEKGEKGERAGARVRAMVGIASQRGSSEQILALVEQVLARASTRVDELDALAVCRGPGSLIGLRVGIGTARGIAIGTGKPLIGISSLRAIAAGLGAGPPILALMDAGRGEVYGCLYAPGALSRPLGPERVARPEAFAQALAGREIRVAGPGTSRYRDVVGANGRFQTMASEELLAGAVGLLAMGLLAPGLRAAGFLSSGQLSLGHAPGDLAAATCEPSGRQWEGLGDFEDTNASPQYLRREQGPIRFED